MTQERTRSLAAALGAGRGDLVSLVGGGGKTTAMYRLAGELRRAGLRAAAATTTKIAPPEAEHDASLVCAGTWEELLAGLDAAGEGVPVLGRELLSSGKVDGIPPEWCDRLLASGRVDALVVEADGAARKPVKAPEAWEPVVPGRTTLVVAVVGLSCLGQSLGPAAAFRPERVAEVTGAALGTPLAPETVAKLLLAPDGLLKGAEAAGRRVALLNQADVPGAAESARAVAQQVLGAESPYDRVVIGAVGRPDLALDVWRP